MSLNINLLELKVDPLTNIRVFRRSYVDSSLLEEIRKRLSPDQIVTRLGDEIWGYSLPASVVNQYGFNQATCPFIVVDPRFSNRLLRHAVHQRLEQLGLRKAGYDKFEQPDEIVFTLGDESELTARSRWLVRPFSLPRDGRNILTLLINPRLAYSFEVNLERLSVWGFDWQYFGDRVRAVPTHEFSQEASSWKVRHTVQVIEERGANRLLCEWRDGKQQEVDLAQCWPLASATNRYRYLRHRYTGLKGEQLAKEMKAKEEEFFALKNVHRRIEALAKLIGRIELADGLNIQVGDLLELTLTSRQYADKLQLTLIGGDRESRRNEELADEADEEDMEEVVQLELF